MLIKISGDIPTAKLTVRIAKNKFKYANQKHTFDFIVDGNCNADPLCHHFRDIHSPKVGDLDLDC